MERGPNVPENAEIREKTWREEPGGKSTPFHAPWRQRERGTPGSISIVFKYENNDSEMIILHFSHLLISSDSG